MLDEDRLRDWIQCEIGLSDNLPRPRGFVFEGLPLVEVMEEPKIHPWVYEGEPSIDLGFETTILTLEEVAFSGSGYYEIRSLVLKIFSLWSKGWAWWGYPAEDWPRSWYKLIYVYVLPQDSGLDACMTFVSRNLSTLGEMFRNNG